MEEILSLMLRKGADIEMRNRWGETPLHNTCKRGNLESSIYLVDNGADINAVDTFGETGNAPVLLPSPDAVKLNSVVGSFA